MNRIKLRTLAELDSPFGDEFKPVAETSVSKVTHSSTHDLLDYSLFIPLHYEPQYAYPLVVWLHSDHADHSQILQMMPKLSARNFAAVAVGSERDHQGRCWLQDSLSIHQTAERIHVAMDHAKLRLNIDSQRVFIAGMGSGGSMALRLALAFPHWFCGVASLNGELPSDGQPLANWHQSRSLPVFWAHARNSQVFSEGRLCQQLRLLHIAGFSVVLRQYPCDDQLVGKVYSDMNVWIMETISQSGEGTSIVQ